MLYFIHKGDQVFNGVKFVKDQHSCKYYIQKSEAERDAHNQPGANIGTSMIDQTASASINNYPSIIVPYSIYKESKIRAHQVAVKKKENGSKIPLESMVIGFTGENIVRRYMGIDYLDYIPGGDGGVDIDLSEYIFGKGVTGRITLDIKTKLAKYSTINPAFDWAITTKKRYADVCLMVFLEEPRKEGESAKLYFYGMIDSKRLLALDIETIKDCSVRKVKYFETMKFRGLRVDQVFYGFLNAYNTNSTRETIHSFVEKVCNSKKTN